MDERRAAGLGFRTHVSAAGLLAAAALTLGASGLRPQDPLPSWNDGPAKRSILAFVASATAPGPKFVAPGARIAVFDNDGTLWTEQPMYVQEVFMRDRLRALRGGRPEPTEGAHDRTATPSDRAASTEPSKELARLVAVAQPLAPVEEYERTVLDWLRTARHPRFRRPYTELVYQPMLELLASLRANGFKTYIVSGGGTDFMRPWTERVYGVPPEQVVGSALEVRYELHDTVPVLVPLPKIDFVDDGPGKPAGIERVIGRRPVAAAGNSDGDQQMLELTAYGRGARLMLLVHHDDAVREYAYDRNSKVGRLDKALDEARARDWTVVSMKHDWKYIFPFEMPAAPSPR